MPSATNPGSGLPRASTQAERYITIFVALIGVGLAVACGAAADVTWSGWQWAVVIFVAFDLVGGIASMPLPPSLKKIRVSDQPLRPIAFTAFHIHPFLIAMAISAPMWPSMFALHASALSGVILMSKVSRAFAASIALSWCACAIAIVSTLGVASGLEWLAPAYMLKLVGSHAVSAGEQS